jgi:CDP-diacylglycerol pyrophosphatase
MDFVNVNGAESPALGTVAPENFLHLPVNHVRRDFLGGAQNVSVTETFIVAEALSAGTQAAH